MKVHNETLAASSCVQAILEMAKANKKEGALW